jgi:hypothetical protein
MSFHVLDPVKFQLQNMNSAIFSVRKVKYDRIEYMIERRRRIVMDRSGSLDEEVPSAGGTCARVAFQQIELRDFVTIGILTSISVAIHRPSTSLRVDSPPSSPPSSPPGLARHLEIKSITISTRRNTLSLVE